MLLTFRQEYFLSKLHLVDDYIQLTTVSVWVVVISPCFTPVVVIVVAKRWQKYLRARNSAGIERRPDYTTRIPLDPSMRFRCGKRGVRGEAVRYRTLLDSTGLMVTGLR